MAGERSFPSHSDGLHQFFRNAGTAFWRSPRAVEMSVYIVRAFVKLREMLASNKELLGKLNELDRKLQSHDQAIVGIIHAIRELMARPIRKRRPIGFTADLEKVE